MGNKFKWTSLYKLIAKEVLKYRNNQKFLIEILLEIRKQGFPLYILDDKNGVLVTTMDPFTFFSSFNRSIKSETRFSIIQVICRKLGMDPPENQEFNGIPSIDARNSYFLPMKKDREIEKMDALWDLFEYSINGQIEEHGNKVFESCMDIFNVGMAKLTIALYWINPEKYVATDKKNLEYFGLLYEKKFNIKTFEDYISFNNLLQSKAKKPVWELSHEAHLYSLSGDNISYWAGGLKHGETSMSKEFSEGNYWKLGWNKNDNKKGAKHAWMAFEEINVGDEFAIKGLGGSYDLKIHYIGKVLSKDQDIGEIRLTPLDRVKYRGKAPSGEGAGSWFNTLINIKREDDIDMIFHGKPGKTIKSVDSTIKKIAVEDKPEVKFLDFPLNQILYGPPGTGKTYFLEKEIMEKVENYKFITFHQSYSYEEFVEGLRPVIRDGQMEYEVKDGIFKSLVNNALSRPDEQFFLLIDEINRANISKVFGELITLIEKDKRLKYNFKEEKWEGKYRVSLPYSHNDDVDGFGVPQNLHIIGTMNTADRSIALMDIALRRRFDFKEMVPDYEVIESNVGVIKNKNVTIELSKLLKAMNHRIEILHDREHQLGHSFFLKAENFKDLERVFIKEIIPLLQEYFYGDWKKIMAILGETSHTSPEEQIIRYESFSASLLEGYDLEEDERKTYSVANEISPKAIRKIY
jgi:AAA domain (dynein-related subfamily)